MIPVVSPAEMRAIDQASPVPVDVLIGRAGAAVARAAFHLMGGAYGRRVVVVAGKGNNGADGRAAAAVLARRGARVLVVDAVDAPRSLPAADLVVDAAYGTGFRGLYVAPDPGNAPVLAVDIPSGVDGLTGEAGAPGTAVHASRTVTFAALKPGLLLYPGAGLAGRWKVADTGLDVSGAASWVVELSDALSWLPSRSPQAHKWGSAVWVVAGSPGMVGAAQMCAAAAMRAGSGMVLRGSPGCDVAAAGGPMEVVGRPLPTEGWDARVAAELGRVKALAIGPGLSRSEDTASSVRRLLAGSAAREVPAVVDADGLVALGDAAAAATVLRERSAPTVLTPHAGEFAGLAGAPPGADRFESARDLARRTGAVVLLKGSPTIVADPTGQVLVGSSGDSRLATAGTGDVLTGVVAAFLARGLDGLHAAGAAVVVHGEAGRLGWKDGLVASDLLATIPHVLSEQAPQETGWRRR